MTHETPKSPNKISSRRRRLALGAAAGFLAAGAMLDLTGCSGPIFSPQALPSCTEPAPAALSPVYHGYADKGAGQNPSSWDRGVLITRPTGAEPGTAADDDYLGMIVGRKVGNKPWTYTEEKPPYDGQIYVPVSPTENTQVSAQFDAKRDSDDCSDKPTEVFPASSAHLISPSDITGSFTGVTFPVVFPSAVHPSASATPSS